MKFLGNYGTWKIPDNETDTWGHISNRVTQSFARVPFTTPPNLPRSSLPHDTPPSASTPNTKSGRAALPSRIVVLVGGKKP